MIFAVKLASEMVKIGAKYVYEEISFTITFTGTAPVVLQCCRGTTQTVSDISAIY